MRVFRLAIGLMMMALVSACGGSSPTSSTNLGTSGTGGSTGTNVSIPMNASTLGSSAYVPNPVTVAAGTTVTWVNNDTIAHTSTSDSGAFDTGTIAAGASASFTFRNQGSFPYHCTFHPGMIATVTVQ